MAYREMGSAKVYVLEQEHEFGAPVARVFEALTRDIGLWWWRGEDGKGPSAVLEQFVGGRFFHDAGDGKGNLYGLVSEFEPPRRIKLTGDFCNCEASFNVVTIRLEPRDDGGTTLRLSHHAAGEGDDAFMASFDEGWQWGFDELQNYLK